MNYQVRMHPTLDILVSSVGGVYLDGGRGNKPHWCMGFRAPNGYMRIKIHGKYYGVHRLVAETFIPNPHGYPEVDHIDRSKGRGWNTVDNLRWVTRKMNARNTSTYEAATKRGGIHKCEDKNGYARQRNAKYRLTHKNVYLANGTQKWFPLEQALKLQALPVRDRVV